MKNQDWCFSGTVVMAEKQSPTHSPFKQELGLVTLILQLSGRQHPSSSAPSIIVILSVCESIFQFLSFSVFLLHFLSNTVQHFRSSWGVVLPLYGRDLLQSYSLKYFCCNNDFPPCKKTPKYLLLNYTTYLLENVFLTCVCTVFSPVSVWC